MSWTTKAPTQPGHYWTRTVQEDGRRMFEGVAHLVRESDGELHCTTATTSDHVGLWEHCEWWSEPITPPAPVRDAAESAQIVRADDCLDSVLASAECDCIPNEFQCVKHGAMDEVRALRARVAGLEGERDALREDQKRSYSRHDMLKLEGEFRIRCAAIESERDAARALLAVERELFSVCEVLESWHVAEKEGMAESEEREMHFAWLSKVLTRLRALAQPRAERETK